MDQREQGTRRTDGEESGRTAPERRGERGPAETGVQLGRGKGDAFEPEESAPAETPETD